MTSVADSAAVVEGVKAKLTVQDAPAAMLDPQVFEGEAKSAALLPVKARLLFANGIGSEVLFVSVTVCGADVTPCGSVPKLMLEGETANVGIKVSLATNAAEVAPLGRLVWKAGGVAEAGGKTGNVVAENVGPVI